MKVLLDSCVWGGAKRQLTELGHDVAWSGEWNADPGDSEILDIARREGRILVTQDKDFGTLAVVNHQPHSGIIRLVSIPARRQAEFTHYVLLRYGAELLSGGIATVDTERIRMRSGGKTWSVP